MGRWRHRHEDRFDQLVSAIVEDCEAFLAGRYLGGSNAGATAPSWSWFARVAHGSVESLERLSGPIAASELRPEALPWWRATRALATAVLTTAEERGIEVIELQRRVLIPLELALGGTEFGPATMLREAAGALAKATEHT